jgi:hypothetical protein
MRKFGKAFNLKWKSLALYRKCLRAIDTLIPSHQKLWYDYLRITFDANKDIRDPNVIESKIRDAHEQIEWVNSIVIRKGESKF